MRTITDHLQTVDGVSESLASTLADRFSTYDELAAATTDDLRAVKGVGPVLATRIQAAAIEASPAAATEARTDRAAAAARTATTSAATSGTKKAGAAAKKAASTTRKATEEVAETGRKASSTVTARADKSATAAKAAASRAKSRAAANVDDATDTAADAANGAARTTAKVSKDFAESIDRRQFGPFTLPTDLPWPVNFALDTTEAVVGVGLKVTTGVLHTVGRKLR